MSEPQARPTREQVEAAKTLICNLASGKVKHFRMCVPPQPDDGDMLLISICDAYLATQEPPKETP